MDLGPSNRLGSGPGGAAERVDMRHAFLSGSIKCFAKRSRFAILEAVKPIRLFLTFEPLFSSVKFGGILKFISFGG